MPSNRMRVQLQTGSTNAWSKAKTRDGSAVTVADINAALDEMDSEYKNGNISNGPPRDNATKQAFDSAMTRMKNDIAVIPPNGTSAVGNVKRKTFRDSNDRTWRIDVENLAGTNLTS